MNEHVKAAQGRVLWWCCLLFGGGGLCGAPLAKWYLNHSSSPDRIFHAIVIWASCAVTFPMFALSLRLLLWGYYQSVDSAAAFAALGQKLDKIIKPGGQQPPAGDTVAVPVEDITKGGGRSEL